MASTVNIHAELARVRGHRVLILRHCGGAHGRCNVHVYVHCTAASYLRTIVLLNDLLVSYKSKSAGYQY